MRQLGGATSGIGAGIARAFAAAGDHVVAAGASAVAVSAQQGGDGIEPASSTCAMPTP